MTSKSRRCGECLGGIGAEFDPKKHVMLDDGDWVHRFCDPNDPLADVFGPPVAERARNSYLPMAAKNGHVTTRSRGPMREGTATTAPWATVRWDCTCGMYGICENSPAAAEAIRTHKRLNAV